MNRDYKSMLYIFFTMLAAVVLGIVFDWKDHWINTIIAHIWLAAILVTRTIKSYIQTQGE